MCGQDQVENCMYRTFLKIESYFNTKAQRYFCDFFTFVSFTSSAIDYYFTCNKVHLGGNFSNVTKYRYRRFKMLKVVHFSVVNCDLCFYSLLQIIVDLYSKYFSSLINHLANASKCMVNRDASTIVCICNIA